MITLAQAKPLGAARMRSFRSLLAGSLAVLALACAPILAQPRPLELISLTPPTGSGYDVTYRLTVADGSDAASVSAVGLYVTASNAPVT